jgi:hypothetical protein
VRYELNFDDEPMGKRLVDKGEISDFYVSVKLKTTSKRYTIVVFVDAF